MGLLDSIGNTFDDTFGDLADSGILGGLIGASVGGMPGFVVGSALGAYMTGGPEAAAAQGIGANIGMQAAGTSGSTMSDAFGGELPDPIKNLPANQILGASVGGILAKKFLEHRRNIVTRRKDTINLPYVVTREGVKNG